MLFNYWTMAVDINGAEFECLEARDDTNIRPVRLPQEVQSVAWLYGEAFAEAPWPESWMEFAGFEAEGVFVATAGERLVGFLISYELKGEPYISVVGVAPEYRRRGIAQRMILRALQRFAGKGFREVKIDVRADNLSAVRCYESVGFRKVGEFRADEQCRIPAAEEPTGG